MGQCSAVRERMPELLIEALDGGTRELTHTHIEDCEDCATESGQLDRIDRVIQLSGALDAEQRRRLLEIADRCPVHRTLHSEVNVRTTLASDDTLPVIAEVPAAGAPA